MNQNWRSQDARRKRWPQIEGAERAHKMRILIPWAFSLGWTLRPENKNHEIRDRK